MKTSSYNDSTPAWFIELCELYLSSQIRQGEEVEPGTFREVAKGRRPKRQGLAEVLGQTEADFVTPPVRVPTKPKGGTQLPRAVCPGPTPYHPQTSIFVVSTFTPFPDVACHVVTPVGTLSLFIPFDWRGRSDL